MDAVLWECCCCSRWRTFLQRGRVSAVMQGQEGAPGVSNRQNTPAPRWGTVVSVLWLQGLVIALNTQPWVIQSRQNLSVMVTPHSNWLRRLVEVKWVTGVGMEDRGLSFCSITLRACFIPKGGDARPSQTTNHTMDSKVWRFWHNDG